MTALSRTRPLSLLPVFTAGLLLLGACASGTAGSGGGGGDWTVPAQSQSSGTALPPPGVEGGGSSEGLPPVSSQSLPSQGAPAQDAEGAAPTAEEGVIFKGPDGTTWAVGKQTDEETYRADIENCYNYAWAQTRRDAQITDDRNAGIDTLTSQSRYSALRQRVDEFDLRNRRGALMTDCMEAKGYARTDTVLPRVVF